MPTQTVYHRKQPGKLSRLAIDFSLTAATPQEVVSALALNQIIVTAIRFTVSTSTTLTFLSATNKLTGAMTISAQSESIAFVGGPGFADFLSVLESNVAEALNVTSSANCQFSGWLDYYYDTARSG